MNVPVIQVEELTKVYPMGEGGVHALQGVSFNVQEGEIIALVGPSGCGKTTLMNILGGLDKPTSGRYCLFGRDVSTLSRDEMAFLRNHEIGFVFQNYNLIPRASALDNVALPMLYRRVPKRERHEKAHQLLERVGLKERQHHEPTQLSGGQLQRIAIARALANNPRIILADEPTGNLDTATGLEIIELMKELNQQEGVTLVLVTHDSGLAGHSHRIVHLRDGRVEGEERVRPLEQIRSSATAPKASGERTWQGASIRANLQSAIRALSANKMRSVLTTLGVVIGVASVITMITISQGTKAKIENQMAMLGSNRLSVIAGSFTKGGRHTGAGTITTLTTADASAIAHKLEGVKSVAPMVRGTAQFVHAGKNWQTAYTGTTPEYLDILNWNLELGSNFTADDLTGMRKVCLLGKTPATHLFGNENPIGKIVRIKHLPFTVIGVLEARGVSFGVDQDDIAIIPITTAQRKLLGIRHVPKIEVSAISQQATDQVSESINALLRERHRINGSKPDDFRVRNSTVIIRLANNATTALSILLGGTASIALIVGGIGIMNIMLVSVTERTREIGIRLAVGATRRDIRRQFLTEALFLSVMGGAVGVILGSAVSYFASAIAGFETPISLFGVIVGFSFSAIVGICFGFQPASKASQSNPMEALRYE